jgi:hypothetical protein
MYSNMSIAINDGDDVINNQDASPTRARARARRRPLALHQEL